MASLVVPFSGGGGGATLKPFLVWDFIYSYFVFLIFFSAVLGFIANITIWKLHSWPEMKPVLLCIPGLRLTYLICIIHNLNSFSPSHLLYAAFLRASRFWLPWGGLLRKFIIESHRYSYLLAKSGTEIQHSLKINMQKMFSSKHTLWVSGSTIETLCSYA